jgi:diguanylate cyclase (GGDEF)-like protein
MVLGGPTAGAWVAFVSTIERRELDSVPWYGTLANHAVMALAAVVGGLTVEALQWSLQTTPLAAGVANLIAIIGGTLVLVAVLTLTTALTIVLRDGHAAGDPLDVVREQVGRVTVAEIALAWLFTVAYTAVGWWAPLVLALITLALWPVDVEGPDPLTGLVRAARFDAFLDGALSRARRGVGRGGLFVSIDLDKFGPINKDPKRGFAVGNEVLAEIGRRLRAQTRAGDAVARPGGDEFYAYFAGTFDAESAVRIGERLLAAIKRPVVTTAGLVEVGASISLVIVRPGRDLPDGATLKHQADLAMQAQKADGGGVRLYEPSAFEPLT